MANATPEQVVEGPARVPASFGLFSVLQFREPGDRHWEAGGVTWQALAGVNSLGIVGPAQADPSETEGYPKEFDGQSHLDHASVFTLYGQDVGTPVVRNQTVRTDRARDLLKALEEREVERVLEGTVGYLPQTLDNAVPFGSSSEPREYIGMLERFLGDVYGSKGVIHLSRYNAVQAIARNVVEARGGGLFTVLGTPVVAGSGYGDDAAYATSTLIAYRSEIFDNSDRPYTLMDAGNNNLYAIAERTYCIGFEGLALGAVTIGDS